jgi:hypothetical protein
MLINGESQKEVIRPDFNRTIMIDSHGATITSDVGFLLIREIDDRCKIIAPREIVWKTWDAPNLQDTPWCR